MKKFFNRTRIFFISIILVLFTIKTNANERDDKQEMLNLLDQFEQRMLERHTNMQKLMKRFFEESDSSFLEDSFFNDFGGRSANAVELSWQDYKDKKVLEIKMNNVKDMPVEVSVEKGMIKIQSKREIKNQREDGSEHYSYSNFYQSFSVPRNVDENNVLIENKNDRIVLSFPKKTTEDDGKKDLVPLNPLPGAKLL